MDMDPTPPLVAPHPSSGRKGPGRWGAFLLAALLPAYLAVFSLIGFPIRVVLERDIQNNGVRVDGAVAEYRLTHGKRGLKIHNYRVRYEAESQSFSTWIYRADADRKPGDSVSLYYAPLFPRYAKPGRLHGDPWDDNLVVRSLAHLFIGGVCLAMMVLFYRRYLGRGRE
jgi:hypothetical protein